MTEDDTFNALKKVSRNEMVELWTIEIDNRHDFYYVPKTDITRIDNFFNLHGWTTDEYEYRYNYNDM